MDYRLYFIHAKGHFSGVVEMECTDDDAAIQRAEIHIDGRAMELWRLDTLVKAFPKAAQDFTEADDP